MIKNKTICFVMDISEVDESFITKHIEEISTPFIKKINETNNIASKIQKFAIGYIIAKYFFSIKYPEISFDNNDKILANDNLTHISCSHSENLVAVCFSSKPVGIDIEKIKYINFIDIIKRHFNKAESKYITITKNINKQLIRFLKIWTMKESLYKCLNSQDRVNYLELFIKRNFIKFYSNVKNEKFYFTNYKFLNYLISVCSTGKKEKIQIEYIDIKLL